MSLSTHEDIRLEMMDLKSDLTTLTQRLNSTKDDLRKSDLDKERFQKIMDDEVLIMKQELEVFKSYHIKKINFLHLEFFVISDLANSSSTESTS